MNSEIIICSSLIPLSFYCSFVLPLYFFFASFDFSLSFSSYFFSSGAFTRIYLCKWHQRFVWGQWPSCGRCVWLNCDVIRAFPTWLCSWIGILHSATPTSRKACWSSCKVLVICVQCWPKLECVDICAKIFSCDQPHQNTKASRLLCW
jgi:hypothetical protein